MKEGFSLSNRNFIYGMLGLLTVAVLVALSWENHKGHIIGAAPYLIFLLCPALHMFMHRKHGGH